MMMTKYLVKNFINLNAFSLTRELNKLSEKGWKLDHIVQNERCLYVFSRYEANSSESLTNKSDVAEALAAMTARLEAMHHAEVPTERRISSTRMWEQDDKGDLHP